MGRALCTWSPSPFTTVAFATATQTNAHTTSNTTCGILFIINSVFFCYSGVTQNKRKKEREELHNRQPRTLPTSFGLAHWAGKKKWLQK
jgi:hypothetical protein